MGGRWGGGVGGEEERGTHKGWGRRGERSEGCTEKGEGERGREGETETAGKQRKIEELGSLKT